LLRETGSAAHVAALETLAASRGTSLGALASTADDEQAVYAALGIAFVPPELRDEASSEVPSTLLPARSLSGVFHVHTSWSDGTASIAAMARAAHEAGFGFVGISDHSQAAHYAGGLDRGRLLAQREEIARARREVPQIEILHGIEVDVLEDGRLDLDDDTLLTLDFVVASVHSHLGLAEEAQTARIVRAVSHPLVTILGHPTGRLLLGRPGYKFDLDVVARTAAAHGVALEINASPQRLDLGPELIRRAAAHGAQFCINPDAHEPRGFGDVPLGVIQARRAGLPTERVLNAMPRPALLAHLRDRRADAARALGRSIDPPAATSAEATA
jgi:DNA polymerase (family 10)